MDRYAYDYWCLRICCLKQTIGSDSSSLGSSEFCLSSWALKNIKSSRSLLPTRLSTHKKQESKYFASLKKETEFHSFFGLIVRLQCIFLFNRTHLNSTQHSFCLFFFGKGQFCPKASILYMSLATML